MRCGSELLITSLQLRFAVGQRSKLLEICQHLSCSVVDVAVGVDIVLMHVPPCVSDVGQ